MASNTFNAAFCAVLLFAAPGLGLATSRGSATLDARFVEKQPGDPKSHLPLRHALAAANATIPQANDKGFWFSDFTVGAAKQLSLLVDTGSSDVYLNQKVYKPGPKSNNQHKNFHVSFATTNPDGTGTVSASGPVYKDLVAVPNLSVPDQELGATKRSNPPNAFPHAGLVGFASQESSAFGGRPWFHSLCAEKRVSECRFGLAYGTNKQGKQVLGSIDRSMFTGPLITSPVRGEWQLLGDIAVDNKIFAQNAKIVTDSGTSVVYGPYATVLSIFESLGIEHHTSTEGLDLYVRGYFPCDKPPTVGFQFPASSVKGQQKRKIFNIVPDAATYERDGNKCTAALQGTTTFGSIWLVGQRHYIDHNIEKQEMGFADLK